MGSDTQKPMIVPAVMPGRFSDIEVTLAPLAQVVGVAQLDIMDGVFVSATSWPCTDDTAWRELEQLADGAIALPYRGRISYETHLMVADPERMGILLAKGGVRSIVAHIESFPDAHTFLHAAALWRAAGARVSVSLLLDTPIQVLEQLTHHIDGVQVMGIPELGFQGQAFDDRAIARVAELHATYPSLAIAIDGGVNGDTVQRLRMAGASRFIVGSALFAEGDIRAAYERLSRLLVDNI